MEKRPKERAIINRGLLVVESGRVETRLEVQRIQKQKEGSVYCGSRSKDNTEGSRSKTVGFVRALGTD